MDGLTNGYVRRPEWAGDMVACPFWASTVGQETHEVRYRFAELAPSRARRLNSIREGKE